MEKQNPVIEMMTSRLKNDDEQKIHVIKMMTGRPKNYDEQGRFACGYVINMKTSLVTIHIGKLGQDTQR